MYNEEELLKRIDNLESRIVALECEREEYDDEETCPECNEEPCVVTTLLTRSMTKT